MKVEMLEDYNEDCGGKGWNFQTYKKGSTLYVRNTPESWCYIVDILYSNKRDSGMHMTEDYIPKFLCKIVEQDETLDLNSNTRSFEDFLEKMKKWNY